MAIATEQVPGVYRRRVGEVLVTALNDGSIVLPAEVLLNISPDERETLLHAAGRRPPFHTAINTFLLQWPERTVLIDTGAGKAMGPTAGRLPANLRAAGITPGEITDIVLTHMHVDHVGGLLDQAGARAFLDAQLWVAEEEVAFWQDDAKRAAAPEQYRSSFDMARQMVRPYADRLHRFQYGEVMPGLEAIATPGHTPGHTSYLLSSAGAKLLIWGDVVHLQAVQTARPDVSMSFDTDPAQAEQTRRAVFERAAKEDLMVNGMHLSFPGFGRVARAGEAYVIQPEVWQGEV